MDWRTDAIRRFHVASEVPNIYRVQNIPNEGKECFLE
jgi:hypothetical protein